MTANVRFVTAHKTDVLKVPNVARRFRPPDVVESGVDGRESSQSSTAKRPGAGASNAGRVWVLDAGGRPLALSVTLGITDGTSTEIVSPELTVGQPVLVGLEAEPSATPAPTGPGFRF
jgi:HlyD family secretion protein